MQTIVQIFAVVGLLSVISSMFIGLYFFNKYTRIRDFLEEKLDFSFDNPDKTVRAARLIRAYEQRNLELYYKVMRYLSNHPNPNLPKGPQAQQCMEDIDGFSMYACHSGQAIFEFCSTIPDDRFRIKIYRIQLQGLPPEINEYCRNLQFAQQWILPSDYKSADSS